jgi:hypothetical protein
MARITAKYNEGPLPGQGLPDAKAYALLQVRFYSELIDMNELVDWRTVLRTAVQSGGRNLDELREKLENDGEAFIDGAEGDPESVKHGKALLNLAKSF